MNEPIRGFYAEYRFLSNFYYSRIIYDKIFYDTVEHAYQASKTVDRDLRKAFSCQQDMTAVHAKRAGRALVLRPDWEQKKLLIMAQILRCKFKNKKLRDRLLATGDRELIETNTWGDTFWGVCGGVGENHLGKLLMAVRRECAALEEK